MIKVNDRVVLTPDCLSNSEIPPGTVGTVLVVKMDTLLGRVVVLVDFETPNVLSRVACFASELRKVN